MNFEKPQKDETEDLIRQKLVEIEREFASGLKLTRDVKTFWSALLLIISFSGKEAESFVESLESLPHYEEGYLRKSEEDIAGLRERGHEDIASQVESNSPKQIAKIMELSDPEQVKKYDDLVDSFNDDLERIKKEKDLAAVKQYYDAMMAIVEERSLME